MQSFQLTAPAGLLQRAVLRYGVTRWSQEPQTVAVQRMGTALALMLPKPAPVKAMCGVVS